MATVATWQIKPMSGGSGTISHPIIAVAPGCPDGRHPTRDCGCKVFRNLKQAEAYVAEKESRDA